MPSGLQQVNGDVGRQVNAVINNLLYNPQVITRLLAWLNERHPFTQFRISRRIRIGVRGSLLYEGFSSVIGVTGTEALANTFDLDPLGLVQQRSVVAVDHPLANVEESLTEVQLRRLPAINTEDNARTLAKRATWWLPEQKEIIVSDMGTKIAACLKDAGISFLPKPLRQLMINSQQLVSRVTPTMCPPSPLNLAWHKSGSGKVVRDIVTLFIQRRSEISGFLEILSNLCS